MAPLLQLATVFAVFTASLLAQDMEAKVPSQDNNNPIQVEDPSDQTSYISANSPTPIPTSSSNNNALVVCMTMEGTTEGMADVSCSTYEGVTSFSSLATGATGILTASETRSAMSTTGSMETTTGSATRQTVSGTRTSGITASATESGQGSGAERQEMASIFERILVIGVMAVAGGLMGL